MKKDEEQKPDMPNALLGLISSIIAAVVSTFANGLAIMLVCNLYLPLINKAAPVIEYVQAMAIGALFGSARFFAANIKSKGAEATQADIWANALFKPLVLIVIMYVVYFFCFFPFVKGN